MGFGPKDDPKEREVYAIEGARVDFQHLLQRILNQKGISRGELAKRMGKRRRYVDKKLFAEGANPSLTVMAFVFHVLGEELVMTSMSPRKGYGWRMPK